LAALVLAAALAGRGAGPFLARANPTVRLAARIAREDSQRLADRTLESEAFRNTGRASAELFADARRMERSFAMAGAWFGAWCGLVVGLKLLALGRVPRRRLYEIDPARCVSCGRCFMSCPKERAWRKKLAGER
jgi:ferredoxin